MYPLNISEEELKKKVGDDFFKSKILNPQRILGRIDFCVSYDDKSLFEHINFLWAEAKKGEADIIKSFIQLILTIGKEKPFHQELPPIFLGAFNAQEIAFISYSDISDIFHKSDFNWNVTPSNHESKEFKELENLLSKSLESKKLLFSFSKDEKALKEFIKNNFTLTNQYLSKITIDKNNFPYIYQRWVQKVMPSIGLDFEAEKPDILDSDFFLADLLSHNNSTKEITDNLRILLEKDSYRINFERTLSGRLNFAQVNFNDNQKAHNEFWAIYERPPKEEFWDYIIERRDLLVPSDIRERKGSFFTPSIWVNKAQTYLAHSLGKDYQEEYYIWDCAAGTGNLLANLSNPRNIYASTIDKADVDIMKERTKSLNLLENHIFQFDFLNDEFFDKPCNTHQKNGIDIRCKYCQKSKLPQNLQSILQDETKRRKLVIFINPPYAEAGNKRKIFGKDLEHKGGVSTDNRIYEKYKEILGNASNELFAQFFIRIYKEIDSCTLAQFSTLKIVQGSNFIKFRETFKAKFKKGFIVPANTFDNVKGQFPIGFMIWDLSQKNIIKKITLDVFTTDNELLGKKNFYALYKKRGRINEWLREFKTKADIASLGILMADAPDFQHNTSVAILQKTYNVHLIFKDITFLNIIPICIYFSVRHAIPATWLNDRDQFLYPNDKWQKDKQFQNDCLAFMLFHSQNKISSSEGINHFIPFSEKEVGAKEGFASDFMYKFLQGKIKENPQKQNLDFKEFELDFIPKTPLIFSNEAKEVFKAGLEIYRYYHKCANDENYKAELNAKRDGKSTHCSPYNPSSSLYDINEFFKGRKLKENNVGNLNSRSDDTAFNDLIAILKEALQNLAKKLEPSIYEYGFLEE